MNMYMWYSDYFANYLRGHIIVMAKDVSSAREMVMQKWNAECRDTYVEESGGLDEKLAMITKDIAVEPRVISDSVKFILGYN